MFRYEKTLLVLVLLAVLMGPIGFLGAAVEPLTAAEADLASQINNTFRRAVEQVMPSVVFIHVSTAEGRPIGLGSGCIIDSAGYVVTNNHVVADGGEIEVSLPDGRRFEAISVMLDPDTDLAVVQIDPGAEDLPAASLGDSDELYVGDFVIAIGSPFGLQQTVTTGVVSFLGRQTGVLSHTESGANPWAYENFIQTDAAINRGNSGGPLVNLYGEVVGINSNILSPTGISAGYGFAIPSNLVRFVTDELIGHGQVRRGYLGVIMHQWSLSEMRNTTAEEWERARNNPRMSEFISDLIDFVAELPEDLEGILVLNAQPGMSAAEAGMQRFDIITAIDDLAMSSSANLRNLVATMSPGTEARFSVWRDGEVLELDVVLGDRAVAKAMDQDQNPFEVERRRVPGAARPQLGVSVQELDANGARFLGIDPKTTGVVIIRVVPNSLAHRGGLRVGEVISRCDGVSIRTVDDLREVVGAADFAVEGLELTLVGPRGIREVVIRER